MFRKVIAGVLSAVMCTSVLLSDAPVGSRIQVQEPDAAPAAEQQGNGLEGSNSFAKYLQSKTTAENRADAGQLRAQAAAEAAYAVTNLEFDAETGQIRVISSQTYSQRLVVTFTDEDDPSNVYQVEGTATAGENILTELTADLSRLPAFFIVSAQLTDRLNQPLCDALPLKTYTHFVQEMRATDITEFEPEQVVNLDDSSDTNFFVLSEDTVQAESSETCNTLVSADYDHNVYVFDSIDETVRSLKAGQYFYIRPSEEDIITTQILDITIDGDTATITGKDSLDEMFDFIKIEVSDDEQTFYRDMPEQVSEIPASAEEEPAETVCEGETEQTDERQYLAGNVKAAGSDGNSKPKLGFEIDLPGDEVFDPEKTDSETTIKGEITAKAASGVLSTTLSLQIKVKDNLNVYKRFTEVDYYFTLETKTTVTATGKITKADGKLNANLLADLIGEPAQGCGVEKDGSKDIKIALPVPGIFIVAGVELKVTPTLVGSASMTYHSLRGMHYDGKLYYTLNGDKGILERKFSAKASLEISVTLKAGLSILGVLETGVEFKLKIVLSAEIVYTEKIDNTGNDSVQDVPEQIKENLLSFAVGDFGLDPSENTVHACGACIDGTIKVTFTAGVYLKLLVFKSSADLVEIPIWEGHFYYSFPHKEFGFGKCPYIAYKTTFELSVYDLVHDEYCLLPAGSQFVLDGTKYDIPADGNLFLYCLPNEQHAYSVHSEGHVLSSGSFKIGHENKTIKVPVILTTDEKTGAINYGKTQTQTNGHSDISAVPVTTEPAETFTPPMTTCSMPKITKAYEDVEAVQLGPDIWAHAYPDGYIWIHGTGDMKDWSTQSPFSRETRERTRYIVLEDSDPKHGGFINSIGGCVFRDFVNLQAVYMPVRLASVHDYAFSGCTALKYLRYGGPEDDSETFILPETLQSIGEFAFSGCKQAVFGDMVLPTCITAIGNSAFAGCAGITSAEVSGDSAPTLGTKVFDECINLKKAVLQTGIKSIGTYLFEDCCALEDLTIPAFARNSGDKYLCLSYYFNAYAGYSGAEDQYYVAYSDTTETRSIPFFIPKSLTTITVLNGTEVPNNFFYRMSYVKHIILKDAVTSIGNFAFYDCSGLEMIDFGNAEITTDSVILPETLTAIGERAFDGCKALKLGKLTIPKNVETVGSTAFRSCAQLTEVHALSSSAKFKSYGFTDCTALKKAEFGPDVKQLGGSIFSGCTALEELTMPYCGSTSNDVPQKKLEDLFNKSVPKSLKTVRICNADTIPFSFFDGLTSLETVIFDKDLTEINSYAFNGCTGLKELRIGSNPVNTFPETLRIIEGYAFKGCTGLAFGNLKIPSSVTKIGQYAFDGCTGITAVNIPGGFNEDGAGILTLNGDAFNKCTGIKKITLGAGFASCGQHAFRGCSGVEELSMESVGMGNSWLENGVNELLDSASVKSILRLTILDAEEIRWSYCKGMTALESVTLPANLEKVDSDAFKDCEALAEAYLIGEDSDWDNVEIDSRGNDPLLRLVRKAVPVVIVSEPADLTVKTDEQAVFTVKAAGKYALSYLWQSSGDGGSTWGKAGSTEDSLVFKADKVHNGRLYRCVVTDEKGNQAVSAAAKLTVSAAAASEKPAGYSPGDINGDGSIDVSDAVLVARFVAEDATANITRVGVLNADVDGDGNASPDDVILILQFICKKIREFPVTLKQ